MIYEKDWLMRQIEAVIKTVARAVLGKAEAAEISIKGAQTQGESEGTMDELLEKLVEKGEICRGENLLFDGTEEADAQWLRAALNFYEKLNGLSDEYLERHGFSRREVAQGLNDACRRCGLDCLLPDEE